MDIANPRAAREMYSRAGWTIGFAIVVYFINRAEYPGPAATLAAVIVLIGIGFAGLGYAMNWFSSEGHRRIRERMLNALELEGSERVLSLNHELSLESAGRLKAGKIISLGEPTANEAARETAKTAGLGDKVRFESGDVTTKLSYPDANFDVVISSLALSELDADKAIRELIRVLKPGGQIALHEFVDHSSRLAAAHLTDIHPVETAMPLSLGGRIVRARKSA